MSKQAKPLTEPVLRKVIREEIEKTKPKWAYKMEKKLDGRIDGLTNRFYDMDDKFDGLATKEELANFKDEVMTGLDQVMGELKGMREEQIVGSGKLSEHTDTLENHESRLQKLEKPHLASV